METAAWRAVWGAFRGWAWAGWALPERCRWAVSNTGEEHRILWERSKANTCFSPEVTGTGTVWYGLRRLPLELVWVGL